MERLLKIWHLLEHSTIGRYAIAVVIALAAILLRLALVPLLGSGAPFITVFPAVVLIAMLAGFWPAMLIGFLGSLWVEYFIIPPLGIEPDIPTAVRVAIMVLSSGLIGMLGQKMRQSRKQAQEKASQLETLTDKLDTKTKELEAANLALSSARKDLIAQANIRDSLEAAKLEKIRESIRLLDDDRSATITRLRATAANHPLPLNPASGTACQVEILRFNSCAELLSQGQALAIRGAELLDRSGKMVGDGEILAREQALILEFSRAWAQAIELGK